MQDDTCGAAEMMYDYNAWTCNIRSRIQHTSDCKPVISLSIPETRKKIVSVSKYITGSLAEAR